MKIYSIILSIFLLYSCCEQQNVETVTIYDTIPIVDTVFITDTIEKTVLVNNCVVPITHSMKVVKYPENDTLKLYVAGEDTLHVYELDRTFWIVNYEFKDTIYNKYNVVYKDSTITIDSIRGNILYLSTDCMKGERPEDCKARLSVTIGGNPIIENEAPVTTLRIKGRSTPCRGNYATISLKINGTDTLLISPEIYMHRNGWYYSGIWLSIEEIETLTIDYSMDCYEPNLVIPEDRNVYIEKVELNGINYLDRDHAGLTGSANWVNNDSVFINYIGKVTIKPNL